MKLSYNPKYNVAYIQFRAKRGKVKTVHVTDEFVVDMAADGTIYGIELLNANVQLSKGKGMVMKNLTTGRSKTLSLAS